MTRPNCPRSIDLVTRRGRRFGLRPEGRRAAAHPSGGAPLEWRPTRAEPPRTASPIVPLAAREAPRPPSHDPVRPGAEPGTGTGPSRELDAIQSYLERCGLGATLLDLVALRTSILNGDPRRIQQQFTEALARGERPERLLQLRAWEGATVFTDRERCALAWTDALTQLPRAPVGEAMYDRVRSQFSEQEVVDLSWAIVAMNAWNRLAIAFRTSST
ncbi:MAG TPA: carboxymuconolactone decarboxylase family protein [Thermoplasmata archaeon]|nr:carboxymuconolactone decarboxylase family protein [Thermoplasmata archaeon]